MVEKVEVKKTGGEKGEKIDKPVGEEKAGGEKAEEKEEIKVEKKPAKKAEKTRGGRGWLVMVILGGVCGVAGIVCLVIAFLGIDVSETVLSFPKVPSVSVAKDEVYSPLTGEVLADKSLATAPAFCIQTPNGTDGARPQAGLNQAGVVFEAIAEAGITRFAAIYQGMTSGVIGPVRSLRTYYLDWDTPFDCVVVHAGGAPDALAAVQSGRYREMDENYTYMYRGTVSSRRWNNLFTTAEYLKEFADARGYDTSEISGFSRMTPDEAEKALVDGLVTNKLAITKGTDGDTSELEPEVSHISLRLGGYANFNVEYEYDASHNRYLRSYESGAEHEVYECPDGDIGDVNPESACTLTQVAPTVVVAMMVKEGKASDDYHEDIQTIGEGDVFIFQNGGVTTGRWAKQSCGEQIKFTDDNGAEIKLVPGQTFITAVPLYGSVEYE